MNRIVSIINGEALTTTTAIAVGTDVQHKAVIQLVRTYHDDLARFGRVTFEMRPFETAGGTQNREIALLNERQATLVLTYMRNSEVVRRFKLALVEAFFALTSKAQKADIKDLPRLDLLKIALAAEEERLELVAENEAMRPTVAAYNRIACSSDGSLCITDAAKALKKRRRDLINFMLQNRWCYRRMGRRANLVGYQEAVTAGVVEHKVSSIDTTDGYRTVHQMLITPKGLTRLAARMEQQHEAATA